MAERVPSTALNRRSGEILTRASMGETFELTRHGMVVAIIGPPETTSTAAGGIVFSESPANSQTIGTAVVVEYPQTQAETHTAASPELRPAKHAEPVQAKTKQQKVDDLLRGSRRGK